MSDALAFAVVTESLKALLHDGLSLVSGVIGSYKVSSLAPDLIDTANLSSNQLNVFLYQITPNSALRNADLPTRSSTGEPIRRPVLAVDLHYLITAYSKNESQAEVMLGQASHLLHDRPLFTQADVRNTEIKWAGGTDQFLQKLANSGLSDQMEMVRIAPQPQTTEELSKLWSAFQTHYRPTLAYLASVLLIEAEGPSRKPLPVLTLGEADRGPVAGPSLILPIPLLVEAGLPDREITATLSDTLVLEGHNLDGANPKVDFVSLRDNRRLTASIVQSHTNTEVSVKLADAKDSANAAIPPEEAWSVGSYAATVKIQKAGETKDRTTNRLILTLAPEVKAINLSTVAGNLHAVVTCAPKLVPGQRVALVIGDWEIAGDPITAATDQIVFEEQLPARIKSGDEHVCRLRVDEVESHFIDRTKMPPEFRQDAKKTIP